MTRKGSEARKQPAAKRLVFIGTEAIRLMKVTGPISPPATQSA